MTRPTSQQIPIMIMWRMCLPVRRDREARRDQLVRRVTQVRQVRRVRLDLRDHKDQPVRSI